MPHFTPVPYYVTIIDSEGGIKMSDNTAVPVSHRIYIEKYDIVGADSLRKVFNHDRSELNRFLVMILEKNSGSYGRLTWERK